MVAELVGQAVLELIPLSWDSIGDVLDAAQRSGLLENSKHVQARVPCIVLQSMVSKQMLHNMRTHMFMYIAKVISKTERYQNKNRCLCKIILSVAIFSPILKKQFQGDRCHEIYAHAKCRCRIYRWAN